MISVDLWCPHIRPASPCASMDACLDDPQYTTPMLPEGMVLAALHSPLTRMMVCFSGGVRNISSWMRFLEEMVELCRMRV